MDRIPIDRFYLPDRQTSAVKIAKRIIIARSAATRHPGSGFLGAVLELAAIKFHPNTKRQNQDRESGFANSDLCPAGNALAATSVAQVG